MAKSKSRRFIPLEALSEDKGTYNRILDILTRNGINASSDVMLGVSASGNIKYRYPTDPANIQIIPKAKMGSSAAEVITSALNKASSPSYIAPAIYIKMVDRALPAEDMARLFPDICEQLEANNLAFYYEQSGILKALTPAGNGMFKERTLSNHDKGNRMAKVVRKVMDGEITVQEQAARVFSRKEEVKILEETFFREENASLERAALMYAKIDDNILYVYMCDPYNLYQKKILAQYDLLVEDACIDRDILREKVLSLLPEAVKEHNAIAESHLNAAADKLLCESLADYLRRFPGVKKAKVCGCKVSLTTAFGNVSMDTPVHFRAGTIEKLFERKIINQFGTVLYEKNISSQQAVEDEMVFQTDLIKKSLYISYGTGSTGLFARLKKEFDRITGLYSPVFSTLYDGDYFKPRELTISSVPIRYDLDNGSCLIDTPSAYVRGDLDGTVKGRPGEKLENYLHERTLKRCVKAMDIFSDALQQGGLKASYLSGDGILRGKTQLEIRHKNGIILKDWDGPDYKESIPAFRKYTRDWTAEILRQIREEDEEREQHLRRLLGPHVNNYLSRAIALLVCKNEPYIKEDSVIKNLRGLKERGYSRVTGIPESRCYNLIPTQEMEDLISNMAHDGTVSTRQLTGPYGGFFILRPTAMARALLQTAPYTDKEPELLYQEALDSPVTDDREAETVFEYLSAQAGPPELNWFFALLNLCYAHGFVCRDFNQYISSFASAPKEFLDYVRMQKGMDRDPVAKKVMAEITKRRRKIKDTVSLKTEGERNVEKEEG